ncbi:copper amine oxidase [Cohnella hongkongensis]|uniref:Copper amine oxidase n=1 Tax=Cohnella hongkongensis TaxID=178337 RepID=A0ABV9FM08_9BACL
MKVRKLIVLVAAFTLLFGGVAYADSVSQKLKVLMNNKKSDEVADGGVVVDNKVYISSQVVSDRLQAIVVREDGRAVVYKPNVHMVTNVGSTIFADVKMNDKFKFSTFIQVDSLKLDINALKLTIADPYGEEKLIEQRKSGDSDFPDGKSDFWITMKDISYNFDKAGPYTLRFSVKPVGDSSFRVISEKTINSK